MPRYDFRILLETVEGKKTSYMTQSFVDTSQDLVLSSSQAFHRITRTDVYDRLLRYKFFGEKVCSVLGLPSNQWVYVDQFRLPVDDESNIFKGNVDVNTAFIGNTLSFANNASVNSFN